MGGHFWGRLATWLPALSFQDGCAVVNIDGLEAMEAVIIVLRPRYALNLGSYSRVQTL